MQGRLATGYADHRVFRREKSRPTKIGKHVDMVFLRWLRAHNAFLIALLSDQEAVMLRICTNETSSCISGGIHEDYIAIELLAHVGRQRESMVAKGKFC